MLTIKNLKVLIDKKEILNDFNFSFEKGKIYVLMGPNGSGKSTLVLALAGHPDYSLGKKSRISFKKKNLKGLTPEKRARLGLFLSFQSPLSLAGVSVFQLLRSSLNGKVDPLILFEKIRQLAKKLKIREELLTRSLNEGFSGGERKKMEILQAGILNPDFLIFDEIDTGVDVDNLKVIASFLKSLKKDGKTILLITHYNRILKQLKPDRVLILVDGRLIKSGDYRLAKEIEKNGYEKIYIT